MVRSLWFSIPGLALAVVLTPQVLAKDFPAETFGAVADGRTDNTAALQRGINEISAGGGGRLVLDAGLYFSGSLELRSGVTLHIAAGSTLKAIPELARMRLFQSSLISRLDVVPWRAFVFADSVQDIGLTGGGMIDASGDHEVFRDGVENSPNRHYGIFIVNAERVVVRDLRMRSSAFWMQRYLGCRDVTIEGVDVYNHANKNNDGIDIDSCQGVVVRHCVVDASDDAIVLKANGEQPCRDVLVEDCVVATHASAIKTGTGSVGGFENITIRRVEIRRSASKEMLHPLGVWQGLTGIDLITTDGGPMRNVTVEDITMEDVQNPIHVRLGNRLSGNVAKQGYAGDGDAAQGVKMSERAAQLKSELVLEDVTLANISARNVGPWPAVVVGLAEAPVRNVTLRNIIIESGVAGGERDRNEEPNWAGNGYPGRGMYGTALPAYGLVTNFTQGLVVENFVAIPADGERRPAQWHDNREP